MDTKVRTYQLMNKYDSFSCLHAQLQHASLSAALARFTEISKDQNSWAQAFVTDATALGAVHEKCLEPFFAH